MLSSKLTPERGQPRFWQPSCQGLCRSKWERKPSKQGCSQPCCSTDIICGTGENADAGMWALGWWPRAADGLTEEARMAAWQRNQLGNRDRKMKKWRHRAIEIKRERREEKTEGEMH